MDNEDFIEIVSDIDKNTEIILSYLLHLEKQKEYHKLQESLKNKDCKLEKSKVKI